MRQSRWKRNGRRLATAAVWMSLMVPQASTGVANAAPSATRPGLTAAQIRSALRIPSDPREGAFVDPSVLGVDFVDYLVSSGIRIERQGVKYWLSIEILQPGEGATPFLEVFLFRQQGHGDQFQNYEFQTDRPFPFDQQRLRTATFDGGSKELGDSRIDVAFSSTSPLSGHGCDLYGGGHGRWKSRHGTLSFARFRIETGTSFFGSITEQPTRGRLIYDPGCTVPRKERRLPCPSTWGLSAEAPPNTLPAIDASSPGPANDRTEEAADVGETIFHGEWPENIYRSGEEPVPDADLPPPSWDGDGATASLDTEGFRYGSGAGTFTSKHPP
jgi:hypothetical protein